MRPTAFLVRPFTAEVRQWLNANVDHQLIIDGDVPIDHQHVDAVLAGLEEAGFQEGIVDFEVR
jgi:biopolymer transport protein ExbD